MTTTTQPTSALPFSPLTRRGLSELHDDLSGDLAHFGRMLIEGMDDQPYLDYLRGEYGDEMRRANRLWSEVLDARHQRSANHDHMDGARNAVVDSLIP